MPDLPTGTPTFLFTDIEGSTQLWEGHPALMQTALARHDLLLRDGIEAHHGSVVKSTGDGFYAAFATPVDALSAALTAQISLAVEPWAEPTRLRVRMGLHAGPAEIRDGDYHGPAVNRAARIMAAAHGGQVLLSDAVFGLVREELPERSAVKDLGEHRLKDLGRPERVYQLIHPALPSEFPALHSLDLLPNNLPVQLTSFIGRERELADVKSLLASTHLLTLTGSGGCGKSRLSLQAAADLLEGFPQGVWLVELAPLSDPDLVPRAVAQSLGLLPDDNRPTMQALTDHLKPRNLLLILDNCEHLLSACAALADGLLRACPGLRILASSREGLAIGGETLYPVPSLGLPEREPWEAAGRRDSVRLFAERVASAAPGFMLTEGNAPVVAEVCRRLDGIPLALELAAARVRTMPLSEFSERLGDMFRLLTGGSRTALPRQQTLRALIDWSYNLLTEAERTLLRRLSVFAGGCTLGAAERVCSGEGLGEWEVTDGLGSLVDKSLLRLDLGEGGGRYRLLETVRQYGRDRLLESGEGEGVRDRHLDYYLAFAEEAEERCKGPDQAEGLDRLEAEHDNLQAALEWAGAGGGERQRRLAAALGHFWEVRGHYQEGLKWLEEARARPGASPRVQARALEAAARLESFGGMQPSLTERGKAWLKEAEERYREAGDGAGEIRSVSFGLEKGRQNLALARECAARAREGTDRYTRVQVLRHTVWIFEEEDPASAFAQMEEVLALSREVGNPGLTAMMAYFTGMKYFFNGDPRQGQSLFEESLELARSLKYKRHIARCQAWLADESLKDPHDVRGRILRLEESVRLTREMGDLRALVARLIELAHALLPTGDLGRIETVLEEVESLPGRDLFDGTGNVGYLKFILATQRGDPEGAKAHWTEVMRQIRESPEAQQIYSFGALGHTARAWGAYEQARICYRESLDLRRKRGDRFSIAQSLEDWGVLTSLEGDHEKAARLFGAAESLAQSLGRALPVALAGEYYRAETACRSALGGAGYAAARDEGRALSIEEAIESVMGESG